MQTEVKMNQGIKFQLSGSIQVDSGKIGHVDKQAPKRCRIDLIILVDQFETPTGLIRRR